MENRSVSIVLTPLEAQQGCRKEVFCQDMYAPIVVALQPGLADGAKLYLEGIPFRGPDGLPQYDRLELTIIHQREKKKPVGGIIAATLALALVLTFGGVFGITAIWKELRFYHGSALEPAGVIPNFSDRYYLSQLDPLLQQVAAHLYNAAMDFDSHCPIPKGVHMDDFEKVVLLLKAECPELMQLDLVTDVAYRYDTDTGEVYQADLTFAVTADVYADMYARCTQRVEQILSGTEGMTQVEMEKHIFDSLAMSITYDLTTEQCANAFGALVEGRAKCDGISLAMKWCLEGAGIPSLCILGDPKEGEEGHAWNMVCLDGKYYNLDLTASVRHEDYADTFMDDLVVYYQFNVADHWQEEKFIVNPAFTALVEKPVCADDSQGYYVQNGPYISEAEDVLLAYFKLARQTAETGKPVVFQLEDQADYDQIRTRLMLNDFGYNNMTKPMKYEYCLLNDLVIAIYYTIQ